MPQKGIALLIPLVLVAAVALFFYLLISQGIITNPLSKEPIVKLKTEYKNPFAKGSQYVNPFSGYKNPFDNLK